jgi:hypothetical protein
VSHRIPVFSNGRKIGSFDPDSEDAVVVAALPDREIEEMVRNGMEGDLGKADWFYNDAILYRLPGDRYVLCKEHDDWYLKGLAEELGVRFEAIFHRPPQEYWATGELVSPGEALDWILQNCLPVPKELEKYLPEVDLTSPHSPDQPEGKEKTVEDIPQAPVVPGKYGEPVMVKGSPKKLPSLPAYKLVKALVEAGDKGLSKGQLEPISTDYWRILKGLKDSDPDWNAVIHFPGKPHGRYRIG